MSRFRATTAPSPDDQRIASHLDRAIHEIESAISVARGAKVASGSRAREVERDLSRLLSAAQEIGTITSRAGADPDLMSEDARIAAFRKQQDKRWAEKRAAKKAAAAAAAPPEESTPAPAGPISNG